MSLKAKLEAVIYAAEEPVTLAQLAFLFSAEALEWKAEQEAASAGAAPAPETPQLLDDAFSYLELDPSAEPPTAPSQEPDQEIAAPAAQSPGAAAETASGASAETGAPTGIESEPSAEAGSESPSPPEAGPAGPAEPAPDPETRVPADRSSSAGWEAGWEAEAKRQARQRDREIRAILRQILDELIAEYAAEGRGIEIREIAGGYRMATKPEFHDAVRGFVKSLKPALKLSLPALETLAIIAYRQPITAPEVNEVRGVDASGVFGSLLSRKLIATAGRKQVVGRPILYKTTREFLLRFGLKDLSELPSMEEFEKMAAMELEEPAGEEAAPEGAAQADSAPSSETQTDETAVEEPVEASIESLIESPTGEPGPAGEPSNPVEPLPSEAAPAAHASAEQAETEHLAHD